MIRVRRSEDRGHVAHGWLDSYHSFSFAGYYDPRLPGFRTLRVLNEDRVSPAAGFGTHGHRDMEIVSYVVAGSLAHRDSAGNTSVLQPGDVQRITAGTGVQHSEMNGSDEEGLHLLQIWIEPEREGLEPGYEARHFSDDEKSGQLRLIASPRPRDGALTLHQDTEIHASLMTLGLTLRFDLRAGRHAWVQLVRGLVRVNGTELLAGDGVAISDEPELTLESASGAELLLFDLA